MATFEEYLTSKKIDSEAFRAAESQLWKSWKAEFEQLHPNSFTMQKLNLINPIRRKYPLKISIKPEETKLPLTQSEGDLAVKDQTKTEDQVNKMAPKPVVKPSMPKPVFKPKPKI